MRVLNSASDSGTKVLIVLLFFTFCPRNCQGSFALDDDRLPFVALDEGRLLGYLGDAEPITDGAPTDRSEIVVRCAIMDAAPTDMLEVVVRCDDAMLTSGRVAASNGLDDERLWCERACVRACVHVRIARWCKEKYLRQLPK